VSPFAWDCTRVTLDLGLPTAMTWHCMLAGVAPVFGAAGFVRRWAARGVAMSAVSEVAAQPLRRLVGDGVHVGVLPNGIDVARWSAGEVERTPGPLRLVTAMRLAARKRPGALVELVERAASLAGPGSLELTILGDGPDRGRVERYVRDHGLGWVHLPGRVSRYELRERYAASDVYLSPARLESFGIAALEARTVGLPVIGRQGSGVGEFVTDGVNGRVVDSDDAMALAIADLAREPAEVARMRARNVAEPPAQEWSRVARLAVAEYERALGLVPR
jgi:glycosyltransferase involved in cell wall biosynthesis